MIALGPRDIARSIAITGAFYAAFHIVDRILSGFVQCSAMGCLPW